jgi:hypothetical protein
MGGIGYLLSGYVEVSGESGAALLPKVSFLYAQQLTGYRLELVQARG